jgi:hypothetical protein
MSRIGAPRRLGPFARVACWMSKRDYGQVPGPLEVTAHHPGILRGYGMLEWETGRAHAVDAKLNLTSCSRRTARAPPRSR